MHSSLKWPETILVLNQRTTVSISLGRESLLVFIQSSTPPRTSNGCQYSNASAASSTHRTRQCGTPGPASATTGGIYRFVHGFRNAIERPIIWGFYHRTGPPRGWGRVSTVGPRWKLGHKQSFGPPLRPFHKLGGGKHPQCKESAASGL